MRRFSKIIVCTLALVFCLAVVSTAQEPRAGSNAGWAKATPQVATAPSPNTVKPATSLPEGTTVIYSNFGPGDTYQSGGWIEAGPEQDVFEPFVAAMQFTPAKATYILTQLDLALSYAGAGPNALTVELCQNDDGVPGKLIYWWYVTGLPTWETSDSIVQTIHINPAQKTILLVRGVQYWLIAVPSINEAAVWNATSLDVTATHAESEDGGPWFLETTVPGAFDVLGTPLPE